ncbi:hypothetical protein B9Y88_07485 [Stenotrophomonas maltophilia]|uniref:phage antirepressor KilAC domain-containing protein n=1 Tax=Stenotrophomonas TaxID=40323 RepID=UPI000C2682B4|nr:MULTISPECIES: phage antirepressor KilAC domain-containing protein [unclassified Stenotrophomonas]MCU1059693.1 phage antirepressor KilAC domain-containing protein [Stenotrophomonas maltophilia]MDH1242546.1 phage antirepressor KilAC domain-containing protein [Stenotrophomonas sp. GD03948]MDH1577106.1 phage antirepressor KilAC domain-containing protein [Stenotrophomonas sp. GD03744]PJL78582.1 hypothetical protein B9Y88_07485 [Stenotrophomonas maltophilia]PZT38400.1 hypothetical protein A7X94_0
MNGLILNGTASITSREIADLVDSRHDDVKRSIERLVAKGVIGSPPMAEKPTAGRPVSEYVFSGEQGKRDSIVVVAQLSPEFTARLVDRWQELESNVVAPDPMRVLADPAAMRGLLLTYTEKVIALEDKVAEQAPKVEFHDRVVEGDDVLMMDEAAKLLGTGRNTLMKWMRRSGWLRRDNQPYQDKINAGLLDFKVSKEWTHPKRGVQRSMTPLVTGKGLARLHKLLTDEHFPLSGTAHSAALVTKADERASRDVH